MIQVLVPVLVQTVAVLNSVHVYFDGKEFFYT